MPAKAGIHAFYALLLPPPEAPRTKVFWCRFFSKKRPLSLRILIMPELHFRLRWPDAVESLHYSPSTIVRDYFSAGATYAIAEFAGLSRAAMQAASDRVAAVHGHPCSMARATLAAIEQRVSQFTTQPEAAITVIGFEP